jgi:two-component system CheB/CheR fusion protein
LEADQEELKASNADGVVQMNEKQRSANKEIETSEEVLQSLNRGLHALNAQLQGKIAALEERSNDLNNLLNNTDQATLFLDRDLRVRWSTPPLERLMSVRADDVGRPIGHLAHKFRDADLTSDAERVLETLTPHEREVRTDEGRTFVQRILPYRAHDGLIDGIVMTFSDVTRLKEIQWELEGRTEFAEKIVDTVRDPLVVLGEDLMVKRVNNSFARAFEVTAEQTVGCKIYDLGNGQWNIPALRRLLEDVLPDNNEFEDFEVEHDFPDLGRRVMLLNARRLDHARRILLTIEDITERKAAQEQRELLISELNHRVKNVLATLQAVAAQTIAHAESLTDFEEQFSGRIHALARGHDILVRSDWQLSKVSKLLQYALDPFSRTERISMDCEEVWLKPEAALAFNLIVHELAMNASKYGALTATNGNVRIDCRRVGENGSAMVFKWQESGGPPVEPPRRKGFGSKLIEQSAQHDLNGSAQFEYRPEGIVCEIRTELDGVSEGEGRPA